ncbi:hypothetical protein DIS24_g9038 [Lasiodiplodia hormozganensis]|uniref:ABM domain-containing protein n=1 Tax=Lasiodiplodia hormozganensis TaxID=869390 RepID=A0AA40CKL6_9PEZI|nr:hypothetical protein DIS24_g9038 [Lasiodiplodia hormozganensis]
MAPATENAILPLKPDIDITTGDAAKTWRSTLDTILAQPGLQRIAWGQWRENPHNLQMLIDWDAVSSHQAFIQSPSYEPFLTNISTLLASPPQLTHQSFPTTTTTTSSSSSPLEAVTTAAPVTELVSFYVPATYNTADFVGPWDEFARVAAENAQGIVGSAGAWAEEDDVEHASLKDVGGKGRVFLALIGWESVDAHMAYRETQAFKDSIVKLRALVSGIEMHHVEFKSA